MANIIRIKRSNVQGKHPTPDDLDFGELAINTYDGKLFLKKQEGSSTPEIISIGEVGYTGSQGSQGDIGYTGSRGDVGYTGSAFGGDYVESISAGTGISVQNNSGTGSTPEISIGQDVSPTSSVTFAEINLNAGGSIIFDDYTSQNTRASKLYTNADIDNGLDLNTLMAGDYYYDDIGASIYLVISNTNDGIELQDLTIRA